MKITQNILALTICASLSSFALANPMPNSILVEDKDNVPIVKTQIICTVKGQAPVRTVETTIFEVSNKGQDIVARNVILEDGESKFSEKEISNPVIKKGGLIVPTSKIELTRTVKQGGEKISEITTIDTSGVEFKKGEQPIRLDLQLELQKNDAMKEKVSHAVMSENGVKTRDIVVFEETE